MLRIGTPLAALAVALLLSTRADAAPITLAVGDTLTFNWDLTLQGADPTPPYQSVTFFSNVAILAPGTDIAALFFQELNAGGVGQSGGFGSAGFGNFPGFNDGVFSATYTLLSGAATIDPVVQARLASGISTERIAPLAAPVPEPASMLLLGSGLAGLALKARRRLRNHERR